MNTPFRFTCSATLFGALLGLAANAGAEEGAPQATVVGDETVVASLDAPGAELACEDAAAQTRVSFKALKLPFQPKRVSVFLDGKGVQNEGVEQSWPTITLSQGLHPGRNLVELVLYGDGDQIIERREVVLIGASATAEDGAPAQVSCTGDELAQTAPAVEEPPPDADAEIAEDRTVYVDHYVEEPVYVYQPTPVFVGESYWGAYVPPPAFAYYSAPPVVYYRPSYYGHRPHHWHEGDHGGWHEGGGGWHGGNGSNGSNDRHPVPMPKPSAAPTPRGNEQGATIGPSTPWNAPTRPGVNANVNANSETRHGSFFGTARPAPVQQFRAPSPPVAQAPRPMPMPAPAFHEPARQAPQAPQQRPAPEPRRDERDRRGMIR